MNLRKAAEQALEALRNAEVVHIEQLNAMYALQEALAEPANSTTDFVEPKASFQREQEPVAWMHEKAGGYRYYSWQQQYPDDTPLYTAPPKAAEWVGLTDEDIDLYALDIGVTANKAPPWLVTYARDIEAKLKEKNCG